VLIERRELSIQSLPLGLLGSDLDLQRPLLLLELGIGDLGFGSQQSALGFLHPLLREVDLGFVGSDRVLLTFLSVVSDEFLEFGLSDEGEREKRVGGGGESGEEELGRRTKNRKEREREAHELLPKTRSFSNLRRLRRRQSVEPDSNSFLGSFRVDLERSRGRRGISSELRRTRRNASRETHLHLPNHVVMPLLDVLELVENLVDLDLLQRRVVVSLELVSRTENLGDLLSFLDGRLVHLLFHPNRRSASNRRDKRRFGMELSPSSLPKPDLSTESTPKAPSPTLEVLPSRRSSCSESPEPDVSSPREFDRTTEP